jgi:cephalosporin-C deacetylase
VFVDLSGEALTTYESSQVDPADFDHFWASTLSEARGFDVDVRRAPVTSPLDTINIFDVSFAGYDGQRIRAWLRLPRNATAPLPTIVEFIGYGGGRGFPEDSIFWASCGFAHLQMDTRGQGATWSVGATPDIGAAGPRVPGMMTAGIESRENYYYRRLITDAVRAVDAALEIPEIDPRRLTALGVSQGGGLALAVAGLNPAITDLVSYVPFLCDFPRAITITDADPYKEISRFLSVNRGMDDVVMATLSYFDGVNFAKRATAAANFSTALMDAVCPPSTVMGAYNAYAGLKHIVVRSHNAHEHKTDEDVAMVRILRDRWSALGIISA